MQEEHQSSWNRFISSQLLILVGDFSARESTRPQGETSLFHSAKGRNIHHSEEDGSVDPSQFTADLCHHHNFGIQSRSFEHQIGPRLCVKPTPAVLPVLHCSSKHHPHVQNRPVAVLGSQYIDTRPNPRQTHRDSLFYSTIHRQVVGCIPFETPCPNRFEV